MNRDHIDSVAPPDGQREAFECDALSTIWNHFAKRQDYRHAAVQAMWRASLGEVAPLAAWLEPGESERLVRFTLTAYCYKDPSKDLWSIDTAQWALASNPGHIVKLLDTIDGLRAAHGAQDAEAVPQLNAMQEGSDRYTLKTSVMAFVDGAAWAASKLAQARLAEELAADPMDWPLPCDVTVGHGTMRKGVPLSALVTRMKVLYEMATGENADKVAARTPEKRQALHAAFVAKIAPPSKCHCGDRAADQCPGEWEQGCDLGANESHVCVAPPEAEEALAAALAQPAAQAVAPEPQNDEQAASILQKVADLFGIGEKARTPGVILTNIENAARRSRCLSMIEAHHVATVLDDDGEEMETQLLNWGEDPEQYIETYRAALAAAAPVAPQAARPSYVNDPKRTGVGDWCAPGPAKDQRRRFVLRFEDADRGEAHFFDEDEAYRMFANAEARGWNCHLLAHMPRIVAAPVAPVEIERNALRKGQAAAVMPLIGPLLDAWECCSQSVRESQPELDKQLRLVNRAMEDAAAPAAPQAAQSPRGWLLRWPKPGGGHSWLWQDGPTEPTHVPFPRIPLYEFAAPVAQPIGYMSPKQLPRIVDPDGESGAYIPMRKTPAGNFTLSLYTAAPVAQPLTPQSKPQNADDMHEPKNGEAWQVHWWNDSARLMLPSGSTLDKFNAFRNGTLIFTIKRAHGIGASKVGAS